MLYGLYQSVAGALANSYRQDVVANNLANVDTVAFKRDLALLQARPTESATSGDRRHTTALLEQLGGGTFALPTWTDFTPGALEETGNKLDVALTGRGFFMVDDGGQTKYTRDGRFRINDQNQLVTQTQGLVVLDNSGNPIEVDRARLDVLVVDESGSISQGSDVLGQLGVVDFSDTKALKKEGNNFYTSAGGAPKAVGTETLVKQGMLESSGVSEVSELVNLIRVQRLFQSNFNMLKIQDQVLNQAVTRLAAIT
ncbi:MAG: flagellar basal-body rod protein FlgF [Sedimentisphaerales bacterium]|nr:flagellar basal-body rod protein FlgF [Sedimentisphaerales bacterium]